MSDPQELSRRERQIMNALYVHEEATVNQIVDTIPEPPTPMAVRRMLHILEEKGYVKRRPEGREMVYRPLVAKSRAGLSALKSVLDTFFGGSMDDALAAHFGEKGKLSAKQMDALRQRIEQARKEGK